LKIVVIKCGGSVLDELTGDFFDSLADLMGNGYHPVIVHGGGPAITKLLDLYKIPTSFIGGLRVTCEKTMEIAEMVLSGQTNRQLCSMLSRRGFNVLGINGNDGGCLQGTYLDQDNLGFVGTVSAVKTDLIFMAVNHGYIPVITPIAAAQDGGRLNINGDYAAAAIAKALKAERCSFVTNVDGILIDGEIVSQLTDQEAEGYISDGSIYGGMVPKVKSALAAMSAGVETVMIISGKKRFYNNGSWLGTSIAAAERITR
jgi:acetylglutamate kinase